MKKYLLIFFLFYIIWQGNAQIQISIDSIKLNNIACLLSKDFSKYNYDTFFDTGPSGIFWISIKNLSDTMMIINYNELKLGYLYYYKGKLYHATFNTLQDPFARLLLLPDEIYSIKFNEAIILNSEIFKRYSNNYSQEMIDILPTIRVYCIDKNNKIYFSDKYKNIIIKKYQEIEGYKDVLNINSFLRKLRKKSNNK